MNSAVKHSVLTIHLHIDCVNFMLVTLRSPSVDILNYDNLII
jgi:hypothetical protein